MMLIESFWRDLRLAARQLLAAPLLTTTAVVALALGMGANTAIFSLFDAIVSRTLPVEAPHQLVLLGSSTTNGPRAVFSQPAYEQLAANADGVSDLFAHGGLGTIDVAIAGIPERTIRDVAMVSGNYFGALRIATAAGRPIVSDDDTQATVAVISHRLWTSRFGADPAAIGRFLTLNGTTFTIVGVASPQFFGTSVGEIVDIWIPLAAQPLVQSPLPGRPPLRTDVNAGWLTIMGRLKPGVTREAAERTLDLAYARFLQQTFGPTGENRRDLASERLAVHDGSRGISAMRDAQGAALSVLMVLVGIVLLIACANVANLFIGRAVSRQREIAIRQALGASRMDLVRQRFAESLIVAVSGGALGVILARWAWEGLLVMMSPGRGFAPIDIEIDARLLAFVMLISCLAAVLCGVAPAWQMDRRNLVAMLKADAMQAGWSRRGRGGLAKALLVAQVALSACLLVAAGELVRSFWNLTHVPMGFAAAQQIVLRVDANRAGVPPDQRPALFERVRERIASVPGVRSAAMSNTSFFSGGETRFAVRTGSGSPPLDAIGIQVTSGYFSTLGLAFASGRDFAAGDTTMAPRVAIINESLAHRAFGERNPIGAILTLGKTTRLQVVGVVGDARYRDVRKTAPPMLYTPLSQASDAMSIPATAMFTIRVESASASADGSVATRALASSLARAVHDVAPQLVVSDLTPMTDLIARTFTTDRLIATLSAAFALLAIVLAACGLYAVMSTAVARRSREMGIRAALGAEPARLARTVLHEALGTVSLGIAIGLLTAMAGTSLIAHFVFGLSARDPLTFAAVAIALLVIGTLASYVPARRAATSDPLIAIRGE